MTSKTLNVNKRAETLTKAIVIEERLVNTSMIEEEVEEYEASAVNMVLVRETSQTLDEQVDVAGVKVEEEVKESSSITVCSIVDKQAYETEEVKQADYEDVIVIRGNVKVMEVSHEEDPKADLSIVCQDVILVDTKVLEVSHEEGPSDDVIPTSRPPEEKKEV
ncbi:unnamed protein product [Lactuca virosa]|uniref:Uncharacterized protein n=1 Tax=Lactuca virosa TaxID=75947 RepID=A0AAU9PTF4_9ASTR|nr:unnamed protein product [Lactuca virosa]